MSLTQNGVSERTPIYVRTYLILHCSLSFSSDVDTTLTPSPSKYVHNQLNQVVCLQVHNMYTCTVCSAHVMMYVRTVLHLPAVDKYISLQWAYVHVQYMVRLHWDYIKYPFSVFLCQGDINVMYPD